MRCAARRGRALARAPSSLSCAARFPSFTTAESSLCGPTSAINKSSIARISGYVDRPYPYSTPLSPAVSVMLQLHRLKPEQITPTGPKNRILKADVVAFLSGPKPAPQPVLPPLVPPVIKPSILPSDQGTFEDIPNSNVRRVIAARLTESKITIPHSYVTAECVIDNVLQARAELNASEKVKISVNDFIIRALALALRDIPEANAVWKEEGVRFLKGVDISVAVATPKGLFTPVIKNAHEKGVLAIADEVKSLAQRAKEGKLKPEDYQGGTASVSNLGMFGIDEFTAVINPPQACILAVGQGRKVVLPPEDGELFEPVPEGDEEKAATEVGAAEESKAGEEASEEVTEGEEQEVQQRLRAKVVTSMAVRLSCDSRVVNDEAAAALLSRFRYYIEKPGNIIV